MTTRPLELKGFAYVELYVANAYQAAFFYCTALGFRPVAVAAPSVSTRDRTSFVLRQGAIVLILTGARRPDSVVATHVHEHGDTVRDVAFLVADAEAAFACAVSRGAQVVAEPTTTIDHVSGAAMVKATIAAPGDAVHSLVQVTGKSEALWPGYQATGDEWPTQTIGIQEIDHVAVGLHPGSLESWVDFYKVVFGFRQSHSEMILTSRSGMNSKVVEDADGRVRIPMVESLDPASRSQIDDFLACHRGPGAQHVAFATRDIVATIEAVRARGVRCLSIPATYYDELASRLPDLALSDRMRFQSAGALVDSESGSLLLQTFTEPLHQRPTLFVELIERRGARGFGGRNIQALFEAVERDRTNRGLSNERQDSNAEVVAAAAC